MATLTDANAQVKAEVADAEAQSSSVVTISKDLAFGANHIGRYLTITLPDAPTWGLDADGVVDGVDDAPKKKKAMRRDHAGECGARVASKQDIAVKVNKGYTALLVMRSFENTTAIAAAVGSQRKYERFGSWAKPLLLSDERSHHFRLRREKPTKGRAAAAAINNRTVTLEWKIVENASERVVDQFATRFVLLNGTLEQQLTGKDANQKRSEQRAIKRAKKQPHLNLNI